MLGACEGKWERKEKMEGIDLEEAERRFRILHVLAVAELGLEEQIEKRASNALELQDCEITAEKQG